MRRILLIIAAVPVVFIAWDRGVFRIGPSAGSIMALKPGMTMGQVRSLLGEPIEQHMDGRIDFMCSCNREKVCSERSSTTFIYTRKPSTRWFIALIHLDITYPMLWVHFNERGRMKEVFVKEYVGIEARRVLHIAKLSPCDPSDRTVERVEWAAAPAVALEQLKRHF
ncbi:MAG TPA: hypothetical protein PLB89_02960 [Flavobacteriales bacterium]|nr:hypothetical protein [Flavobacteriales bacterium]